jgi:uncharacterized protein with FMN-binding domain
MTPRALVATVAGSAAVLGAALGIDHAQRGMATAPIPLPPPVGAASADTGGEIGTASSITALGRPQMRPALRRYTGVTVDTKYGPMQVRIAMRAGRLVRVWALRLTDRYGRSVRASTAAVPVLERRTIAAGSARIVGITGATYTTDGYLRSLQSALDEAAGR